MTKVMLVEDDNNLREIYEARLQAEGYDIVAAKDGEEALVLAKEHKPELVISDVMMPKISGFEMLDILRNTDGLKDVKVIMLTALGQSDDQARADKLGADRYLVKSQVTLEDIVTVARELIDGPDAPEAAPAVDAPAAIAVTPDPVVPAEPVAVAPEPTVVVPSDESASKALAEAATATDDKLMADAVDALMANTETNALPISPTAETTPVTPGPPVIVPDKTQEAIEPDEKTASEHSSVPISGKKVISPVDSSEAAPSIETLLAKEEAKNIQAGAPVPPATPIAPTTVIAPGDKNPNSIAL